MPKTLEKEEKKKYEELESKIEQLSENQRMQKRLCQIQYVAVEFDYNRCKYGEKEINSLIQRGWDVIDNYRSDSGLVVVLGLYRYGAV